MDGVRRKVGFEGDLEAFFKSPGVGSAVLLHAGRGPARRAIATSRVRIDAALPKLFSVFPKADYEVREVEAFRARVGGGCVLPAPSADGSRPGIFYVNTFDLKAQPKFGMETLSLHEASPGHHFQGSIQQELTGLPKFRRFGGGYTAYVEGWALYAESSRQGARHVHRPVPVVRPAERRAAACDAARGGHRPALARLERGSRRSSTCSTNSTLAESDVVSEVERYIAWPGQALGYKIGRPAHPGAAPQRREGARRRSSTSAISTARC